MIKPLFLMASATLVAGCASSGEFPSLAPRPIESRQAAAIPSRPDPVSDSVAVARINAAVAKAQAAVAAFNEALVLAKAAAGKAGARNSDSWIAAQMAVSRLERTRAPVVNALADLTEEQRLILLGPPSADYPALEVALAEVKRIDSAASDAMMALGATLRR